MMWMVPLLLVGVVVLLVVSGSHSTPEPRSGAHAKEILDRRLAVGEVSSEEHARRSATLAESRGGSPARPVTLVIGTVALVGLLVGAVAWGTGGEMGMGWGWSDHDRSMAGHMGWTSTAGSADAPVPGATAVEVVATDLQFDPTSVTIAAGDPVNLTLVNDGLALHDLTIPALGFRLDADPGERASGSLTVDDPGTYAFECSVPGHADAGMRGTLVVHEASS